MYNQNMTYSYDLRLKVLNYLEKGGSKEEARKIFGITTRTMLNWIKRKNRGYLAPTKRSHGSYKIDEEKLKHYIQKHPDHYLREIAETFGVRLESIFYACKRLKITLKKRLHFTKKEVKLKESFFKKS